MKKLPVELIGSELPLLEEAIVTKVHKANDAFVKYSITDINTAFFMYSRFNDLTEEFFPEVEVNNSGKFVTELLKESNDNFSEDFIEWVSNNTNLYADALLSTLGETDDHIEAVNTTKNFVSKLITFTSTGRVVNLFKEDINVSLELEIYKQLPKLKRYIMDKVAEDTLRFHNVDFKKVDIKVLNNLVLLSRLLITVNPYNLYGALEDIMKTIEKNESIAKKYFTDMGMEEELKLINMGIKMHAIDMHYSSALRHVLNIGYETLTKELMEALSKAIMTVK